MPIPTVPWTIYAGTIVGPLTFNGGTGALSGTLKGDPFVGFFDETAQVLKMVVKQKEGGSLFFEGSLFTGGTATLVGGYHHVTGGSPLASTTWFAHAER